MELAYEQEMSGISPLATGHNIEFRIARARKLRESRLISGQKFVLMNSLGFKRIGKLWKHPSGKAVPMDVYKRSSVEALKSRVTQLVG